MPPERDTSVRWVREPSLMGAVSEATGPSLELAPAVVVDPFLAEPCVECPEVEVRFTPVSERRVIRETAVLAPPSAWDGPAWCLADCPTCSGGALEPTPEPATLPAGVVARMRLGGRMRHDHSFVEP